MRQVVVDFLNMNMQDEYAIVWETSEKLTTCIGNVDQGLLKRAVANLIQNSMSHNEDGCTIYVSVSLSEGAGNGTVEIGTGARGGFMVKRGCRHFLDSHTPDYPHYIN